MLENPDESQDFFLNFSYKQIKTNIKFSSL